MDETRKKWGGYVGIPFLKRLYDRCLNMATNLEEADTEKEEAERDATHECCLRGFLQFLVGCNKRTNKSNKHINLLWLEGL